MSFPLLIRDRPYPDEPMAEYLRRISDLNGYPQGPGFMRAVSGRDWPTIKDIAQLVRLDTERLARLPEPWPSWMIRAASGKSRDNAESRVRLNRTRVRWCPACLVEEPYMRAVWSHKLIVACARHRLMLRESCDSCGEVYSWTSAPFTWCACGRALGNMHAETASDAVVGLMSLCFPSDNVMPAMPRNHLPADPLSRLTPSTILNLLYTLAPLVPGYAKSLPGIFPKLHELSHAVRYMNECAAILLSWPSGFQALLQKYVDPVPAETSIRRRFGPLYRVLYKNLAGPEFDFMRREFEHHLGGHWYGVIDGRHRAFRGRKHPVMSGKAMRVQIKCSRETLRRLMETGVLKGHVLNSPSGRRFVVADRSDVLNAKRILDDLLTLRVASRQLGLSRKRMRILMGAGLIASKLRRRQGVGRWFIPRHEVNRLLELPVVRRDDLDPEESWTLGHILRHRCRDHATFVGFMRALLEGKITSIGRASGMRGMSGFLVSKADMELAVTDAVRLPEDGMTAQTVARRLAVKEEVAYQLIRCGLLKSYDYHVNGRAITMVTESSLRDFQQNYIPLIEFARFRRTSPNAAYRWLSKHGFHAVTGPSVDGMRQYFYRTLDIATAARESIMSSYAGGTRAPDGVVRLDESRKDLNRN
uniref:TniQ domain-containing protein n=1 Tax=Burkholderia sp. (strain CCGE1003) TaxID=640512 RepID=E1T3Y0_BURSG